MAHDPYIFGKPIYKRDNLYGRNNIVEEIKENFTNNRRITLLHVQRRIGKTSLITCLPQFFTEEQNSFKFVTFSLQGYKTKPLPKILNDLADDIAASIDGLPRNIKELADTSYNFFHLFLPEIINEYLSGKKLVLLLDEFDVLEEDKTTDDPGENLFDELEKTINQEEKLFAILVFGKPLTEMTYLEEFLQKQKPIEVGLLDKKSTGDLIVRPAKEILEYELGAIDTIWRLSAGHPSITQLLCSNIFRYCRKEDRKKVTDNHVSLILEEAMTEGEAVLNGFLEPFEEDEKLFFRAVAKAQESSGDEQLQTTIRNWQSVGKRLVEEYGFLEEKKDKTGYKIKVELVRRWLVKNYPLSEEEKRQMRESSEKNQNIPKINNNHKLSMPEPNDPDKGPNPIAKIFSLLLVFGLIGGATVFTVSQILNSSNSRDNTRPQNDCDSLLEEINAANDEEKQLQVIQKVRADWSRETETLDEKCPYPNIVGLDAQYDKLLDRYGRNKIKSQEFGEATEVWCEVSNNYEDFSEIEIIFKRWILEPGRISNENKKKVMAKLIQQNQSPNGCPAYSFNNKSNEILLYEQVQQLNNFYYQEAQTYIKGYEFGIAVESYCQITEDYDAFDNVVEQLKEWFNTENYSDDFNDNDQRNVKEKLAELGNQCLASPLNSN